MSTAIHRYYVSNFFRVRRSWAITLIPLAVESRYGIAAS
jgi:hypothetical protein